MSLTRTGTEPGDPDAGRLPAGETPAAAERTIRTAAHRTLRVVSEDHDGSAGTRWSPS